MLGRRSNNQTQQGVTHGLPPPVGTQRVFLRGLGSLGHSLPLAPPAILGSKTWWAVRATNLLPSYPGDNGCSLWLALAGFAVVSQVQESYCICSEGAAR